MKYDEICLFVKEQIATNAVIDEEADTVTMDGNGVDHVAEAVADQFTSKIPEGAVVLTKEELRAIQNREAYQEMRIRNLENDAFERQMTDLSKIKNTKHRLLKEGELEEIKKEIRKETAREIAKMLFIEWECGRNILVPNESAALSLIINKVCVKYGVEVE